MISFGLLLVKRFLIVSTLSPSQLYFFMPPRFGGMKTYNWEGVNPDGYCLDKLEPIPSALPSFQKLFQVSATALRSEERFSRNAETDLVCRLLLEKKKITKNNTQ